MVKSKYRAVPVVIDGIRFASKREGNRYSELKLLEKIGEIKKLELQPKFAISINNKHCFYYIADFAYYEGPRRIIEDVKGHKTDIYRLKKKCVEAAYGFTVHEI